MLSIDFDGSAAPGEKSMTRNAKLQYAAAKPIGIDDIPIIDLRVTDGLDPVGEIATELAEAASEIGFFYVSGHGVPAELCSRAMTASRRLFELSEVKKTRIEVNQFQRGWMRQGWPILRDQRLTMPKKYFSGAETSMRRKCRKPQLYLSSIRTSGLTRMRLFYVPRLSLTTRALWPWG